MRNVRLIFYVILVPLGAFALFLIYATVADYRPAEVSPLATSNTPSVLSDTAELELVIWNIGYGGLDQTMDFFYDGGKHVRPAGDQARSNLAGITSTLTEFSGCDFILLQEVDQDSKRSHHLNQFDMIAREFPDYQASFGQNYKVFFVPVPLRAPMGKVQSGLMSLTKHVPASVDRYSFPGNYAWPTRLFMLDRCFLVERFPVTSGRELVVINTHNSAYDDGSLRRGQMDYLRSFLLGEAEKGNYVIAGGDWNQTPFGFGREIPGYQFDTLNLTYVEEGYPAPEWNWAYGSDVPTNRRVTIPYDRTVSLTTVIDYYLLSPNIAVEEVKNINLEFRHSDHQPVRLRARLIPR